MEGKELTLYSLKNLRGHLRPCNCKALLHDRRRHFKSPNQHSRAMRIEIRPELKIIPGRVNIISHSTNYRTSIQSPIHYVCCGVNRISNKHRPFGTGRTPESWKPSGMNINPPLLGSLQNIIREFDANTPIHRVVEFGKSPDRIPAPFGKILRVVYGLGVP